VIAPTQPRTLLATLIQGQICLWLYEDLIRLCLSLTLKTRSARCIAFIMSIADQKRRQVLFQFTAAILHATGRATTYQAHGGAPRARKSGRIG